MSNQKQDSNLTNKNTDTEYFELMVILKKIVPIMTNDRMKKATVLGKKTWLCVSLLLFINLSPNEDI